MPEHNFDTNIIIIIIITFSPGFSQEHASTQGTLAREPVNTEGMLPREHVSTQSTFAGEHVSTQDTLAPKAPLARKARKHTRHVFSTQAMQFSRLQKSKMK